MDALTGVSNRRIVKQLENQLAESNEGKAELMRQLEARSADVARLNAENRTLTQQVEQLQGKLDPFNSISRTRRYGPKARMVRIRLEDDTVHRAPRVRLRHHTYKILEFRLGNVGNFGFRKFEKTFENFVLTLF